MSDSGKVRIHGKEYKTVALRVDEFRKNSPSFGIETEIIENSDDRVITKTSIKSDDDGGRVIATGYAEEIRNSTNINKTSALENCETSSVGRALAFLGYGGSEIASANEVSDAIIAGAKKEVTDYMASYMRCLTKNLDIALMVREAISDKDPDKLHDAVRHWYDMSEDDQRMMYGPPPSKGGFFSTEEKNFIKENFTKLFREVMGLK